MTDHPADHDASAELAGRVRAAGESGTALAIAGGGTKHFLGRLTQAEPLAVGAHRGIVAYQPTELVITARAGTPLAEVEAALAEHGQRLAFEPPRLGAASTLGGAVASGLSGPSRPWAGAARDFVLGVRVVDGAGEILRFGGEVMKNVAGYDVSRLMTGAMGTLGVLLDVSLKVLPGAAATHTREFEVDAAGAVERVARWSALPLPIAGACHDGERLRVRLAGTAGGVAAAAEKLGGEPSDDPGDGERFWDRLRDHALAPLADAPGDARALWRVSVPPAAAPIGLDGEQVVDWGGAQRWLRTDAPPERVRAEAVRLGGHATLFRGGDRTGEVFQAPPAPVLELHRRLKAAFDPHRILNPGRMYEGI